MEPSEINPRTILDSLNVQWYVINKNFNIVDFNKAFSDHIRLSREQIIGQPCYKLTHNSDTPCWEMPDITCPARNTFAENRKQRTIHKHFISGAVILEEVISTPINNGEYVLEEHRDLSDLLGLVEGILTICAGCKKVKDDDGNWYHLEGYFHQKTGTDFSHSICPECIERFYPEINDQDKG